MRIAALLIFAFGLSGCAVADVAGDAVDVGASVVTTTVDTTGDVIGAAAGTVTGSNDKKSN